MCTKITSGGTGIDDEVMIQQSTILHYFPQFWLTVVYLEKNQVIFPYVTNILVYVYFIDFVDWKKTHIVVRCDCLFKQNRIVLSTYEYSLHKHILDRTIFELFYHFPNGMNYYERKFIFSVQQGIWTKETLQKIM